MSIQELKIENRKTVKKRTYTMIIFLLVLAGGYLAPRDKDSGWALIPAANAAPVGPRVQPQPNWIARDFLWSMAIACPHGPENSGFGNCASPADQTAQKKGK